MQILLVNDDGIHSPGLQALHAELVRWGDVTVVAPAVEQSGVGHTITYLHPIVVHREYRNGEFFGWKAEGSPADCVKLGILEFCPRQPDVVISGINAGANVGINVLYSGTVAAAIEGAFFGIPSIALSQWLSGPPNYQKTARNAVAVCRQLLERWEGPGALWNVNFPPDKPEWPLGVKTVSIAVRRHTDTIEKRVDPRGRTYFWSGIEPIKSHHMDPGSDIEALLDGYVTITPLHFDLTERPVLDRLRNATWDLPPNEPSAGAV